MKKNFNLINARKEFKYTQEKLAKVLNVEKTTVSNWENGYSKPSLDKAFEISKTLKKDIHTLFFGDEVQ